MYVKNSSLSRKYRVGNIKPMAVHTRPAREGAICNKYNVLVEFPRDVGLLCLSLNNRKLQINIMMGAIHGPVEIDMDI